MSVSLASAKPVPHRAMALAAGRGLRLRPLTETVPKPLVEIGGRTLLGHALDLLVAAGVAEIVVNAHYMADAIEAFVAAYGNTHPALRLHLSREETLLETGGGVRHALGTLGDEPFYALNSDVILRDGAVPALSRLAAAFDPTSMDALLLLQPLADAIGFEGKGDYARAPDGRLESRGEAPTAPFVFTGAQILRPALFDGAPDGAFSLKLLYDRAEKNGRLFGLVHDGAWLHVGSPAALALAARTLQETA
jgi:MurNAc alpha-1-phosphate uridylyltransferase